MVVQVAAGVKSNPLHPACLNVCDHLVNEAWAVEARPEVAPAGLRYAFPSSDLGFEGSAVLAAGFGCGARVQCGKVEDRYEAADLRVSKG